MTIACRRRPAAADTAGFPQRRGVERTRATFLSYSKQDQASFTADLGGLLQPTTHVNLVQETFLAMAPATS